MEFHDRINVLKTGYFGWSRVSIKSSKNVKILTKVYKMYYYILNYMEISKK